MDRPKCRRCGGPLDLWRDPETGRGFVCQTGRPMWTDDQFAALWNDLPGDDVVRLLKQIGPPVAA